VHLNAGLARPSALRNAVHVLPSAVRAKRNVAPALPSVVHAKQNAALAKPSAKPAKYLVTNTLETGH
jgi:hypothetical protein